MIDCDELRRHYDAWTVAEHRAFYSRVWAAHPSQSHSAPALVAAAITDLQPRTVVEIGGWDGELAVTTLERFPNIKRWTSVEICAEAVATGHRHDRYEPLSPECWYWESEWRADLFVASHVIEHMSATHLEATVAATDAAHLFIDAPLLDEPVNWWGSPTTHVLEVGWDGVTAICAQHGYTLVSASEHETPPESGGHARACLYRRTGS